MGVYINKAELLKELSVIQDRPVSTAMKIIKELPTIDLVRCGECKYFNLNEWDETICGVPIIVAHEICHKWGDGCKTNIYGFCFMGERRADEHTDKRD